MDNQRIVESYKKRNQKNNQEEISWFQRQPDLPTAIEKATLAQNEEGKLYRHQYRVTNLARQSARTVLLAKQDQIRLCRDFDNLFRLIETTVKPIKGIGELYVYDTSFRIGAFLRRLPEKVYIHSGTRIGAIALLGIKRDVRTLEKNEFPKEFQELAPYEIEDVLCIYKTKFTQL